MKVFHHDDMDGKSAAWLVHTMKPSSIEDHPKDYIMMDYNSKFDKHTIKDDVFVVDYSISHSTYDQFIELCKSARTVTWIDHHASSLDVVEKHKDELQAIKNLTYFVSKCACGAALVYSFFMLNKDKLSNIRNTREDEEYEITARYHDPFPIGYMSVAASKTNKKDKTDTTWFDVEFILPSWLAFVDDYDCWKKIDPKSNMFILGTEAMDTSIYYTDPDSDQLVFNNEVWNVITDQGFTPEIVEIGHKVQSYIKMRYDRELTSTFVYNVDGVDFICKNGSGNSWEFCDLLDKYGQAILFNYDGKSGKWQYSVYASENSKVSAKEFAEKYGGGGHPKAAGFSSKELIFISKHKPKTNQIFLGGTVRSNWREKFIDLWKKNDDKKTKKYKLFNPIVENWTKECIAKENEVKENAILNFFLITTEHVGPYSFVEAVEASHYGKVFLAIYSEFGEIDNSTMKSYEAIGDIIKKNGGKFEIYIGYDKMNDIVEDLIKII